MYKLCHILQLVIDVMSSGGSTDAHRMNYSHQIAPGSSSQFRQDTSYAPPPYSDQSVPFCSQCGTQAQDTAAKFCTSCGQSLKK